MVFTANITHNLTIMADAAHLYKPLWHPDELGIDTADKLIEPLESGLERLKSDPEQYKRFEPTNRWGTYESLVRFTNNCLEACRKYPTARVSTSV